MTLFRLSFALLLGTTLSIAPLSGKTKEPAVTKVTDLLADYQRDPIGIDCIPQLSWRLESDGTGILQTAYRILVSSSAEKLSAGHGDLWDSGKVMSGQSAGLLPEGLTLRSRKEYYWKVMVWLTGDVASGWSEPAYFETGLLDPDDWKGSWIGYVPGMPGRVLYFKGNYFTDKEIARARAYVAGLGFYELFVNGKKVGDHVLDPAQSTYSKRIYYASYDIEDLLHPGGNSIVIPVAPGWLGTPRLRIQVEVSYKDGTSEILNTDRFRSVTTGPTVYSTVFDGECYDARLENEKIWQPGVPPGLMDKEWAWAHNTDDPVGRMVSQRIEPIKVMETITPKLVKEPAPGVYVFDAGRNLAGWVAVKVRGKAGDRITLRFAETLYDNGAVNQENLRNARSEDTYVCKGSGTESWEPSFTYHGFRYVQVEGLSYRPAETDLTVKSVRSSVERTGRFACSSPLLNDIDAMVVNTEASNLHSVPTDCPQRDERMGWLNDMTPRIEQAIYNFDMSRFYAKFIQDIRDVQDKRGAVTCVAPFRFGMRPADPVSASYLILAQKCYEFYGNRQMIVDNFEGMKAWTDFLYGRTEDGIVNYSYYGDWCPPRAFLMDPNGSGISRDTPGKLMSTGYLYLCARMLSEMAGVIGKTADADRYAAMGREIREAFNRAYWDEEKGGYAANNQACNAFALYLGMADGDRIPRVVANLVADVKAHDHHLTTGNLCTKYLLEVLTEHGHVEEAYRIASQTTYPSWGFMLANGATTLWERWEYLTGDAMNSHNHPMMGSVGSWFYKYLLGIVPDFKNPGFGHFTIRPYPVRDLTFAEGELKTVKGTVKVAWHKKGGMLTLDVEIPANSTATVLFGGKEYETGSGKHRFRTRVK